MSKDARSRLAQLSEQERRSLVDRLLKSRNTASPTAIQPQPRTSSTFPLSYAQQRYWVLNQIFPNTTGFNVVRVFHVLGRLDRAAFDAALADLTRRHEVLRTVFELDGGTPVQRIQPAFDLIPASRDLRHLSETERLGEVKRLAHQEGHRLWELASAPAVRAALWRLADDEHAFVLSMHHIISDGWSMTTMMKELFACYDARRNGREPALPACPLQYADYAVWHRQWLESESAAAQVSFWRRRMAGSPTLRLPASAVDAATAAGLTRRVMLSPELTQRLRALTQSQGVTAYMALLAAFTLLLSRYTGQDDVVVGSPVASRTRPELENVVGCFMNPLPFRVDLSGAPTFRQLLSRVRDTAVEVYANQDVPFDAIVKAVSSTRETTYPPLYQAMFLLHNFPAEARKGSAPGANDGLRVTAWPLMSANLDTDEETRLVTDRIFPVALEMVEASDRIVGALEYAPEYAGVLSGFAADFTALLDAVLAAPDRPVTDVLRVSPQTAAREGGWREAPLAEAETDVSDAFLAQAARTPDADAVIAGTERLTYRELLDRVSRLASRMRDVTAAPEAPIAILLDRSLDAVVGLLAALHAGRPYLPLDPALPADRLGYMLEHARAAAVVTRGDVLAARGIDAAVLGGRTVVYLDRERADIAAMPAADRAAVHPGQLAYVLYTSGSTGRPKGVAVTRRGLSHYTGVARHRFELGPGDRMLQFASLSFDTSAEEIYPTLTSGAALVLRTEAMLASVPAFFGACADWRITVLDLPTAYWHQLTAQIGRSNLRVPESLRLVILGGEKALAERVREWRAAVGVRPRLLNTYGPTETTIVAAMCDLSALAEIGAEVPLGDAIPGAQAYVLDGQFRRVPANTVGELYLGGAGLARGYVHDAAMTADRFVPDPFTGTPGARLYRTGDLARVGAGGVLEFAGRADDQVKLRGYRIELGEIESVIAGHAGVRDAVVILREDRAGDPRLVAYVVAAEPSATLAGDLRSFLQQRVPDYMVPSAFVTLDALPRSVQGKVVRAELPAPPASSADDSERYIAPANDVERRVAALWADVLHRERVGVLDNFFDLGGHSLLVIQLHAKLAEAFGSDLALVDLFRFPTVQSQAARLSQGSEIAAAAGQGPAMTAVLDRAARQRQAFRRRPAGVTDKVAG
ncbi:MAG TPA: amino acid adenylation domain-containing protein [Vicinamibacterales bacterium]|nr:amino acid adenylation domain-containing protein [Vicinamibacterales bacterium]